MSIRIIVLFLALSAGSAVQAASPSYRAAGSVSLGTPDKWDYVVAGPGDGRVYVAHGDRLTVIDGRAGKIVGEVAAMSGTMHGTAFAGHPLKGFTDDGKSGMAIVFDPVTLKVAGRIRADVDADGIAADPASGHVFVVNGDPASLTVIDPAQDMVVATVPIGEKPEYAAADGHGALYVAGEEKGDLVRVDTRTNKVTAHWAAADCEKPHGVAVDPAHGRVFLGCVNSEMIVFERRTGRVVAKLAIGRGSDAIVFDPVRHRVFSSNGADGTISAYQQTTPDRYERLAAIPTIVSGRTMTVDPVSGRLFVAGAETDLAYTRGGRPKTRPGTLRLLMFDPVD